MACAAVQVVVTRATVQVVVAVSTVQSVIACAAEEVVVACATVEGVVAVTAGQYVVARATPNGVIVGIAKEQVPGGGTGIANAAIAVVVNGLVNGNTHGAAGRGVVRVFHRVTERFRQA